jgi:hypothetical protein
MSFALEEDLCLRMKRAARFRMSELDCSMGKVKSFPVYNRCCGSNLWKPSQSSVTKSHCPSSTFSINFLSVASLRSPKTHPRFLRETPSMALQTQILFFSVYKMPHLVHHDDTALGFWSGFSDIFSFFPYPTQNGNI